jgi:4-aminobutyrate aminotransferase-like enzyme
MYGDDLSTEEIAKKDEKYTIRGWGTAGPLIVDHGKGAKFWDTDGNEYLDFLSQTAGVMALGHSNEEVIEATEFWLEKMQHTLTALGNAPRAVLAEKLAEIAPGGMKDNIVSYFGCGGTEAVEGAIKAAMNITERTEVISTYHAYHGGSMANISLIGQSWQRNWKQAYPAMGGYKQVPRPYTYRTPEGVDPEDWEDILVELFEEQITYGAAQDNVAAFIAEPFPGNGGHQTPAEKGVFEYNNAWFKGVKDICEDNGIMFIADEVQNGFGRTGKMFGIEHFDVTPDIMTTAKSIGSGIPLSAFSINKDSISEKFEEEVQQSQWHIFTFGGSAMLAAAGCATIDYIQENNLIDKVNEKDIRRHEGRP